MKKTLTLNLRLTDSQLKTLERAMKKAGIESKTLFFEKWLETGCDIPAPDVCPNCESEEWFEELSGKEHWWMCKGCGKKAVIV